MLINLKPHDQRRADVSQIIRRLSAATDQVLGISLYMQPVQDLTIGDTVSKTQYQFVLQDANPTELAEWTPKLVELRELPQVPTWRAISRRKGVAYVEIDRETAGRFGITPATIDNAL